MTPKTGKTTIVGNQPYLVLNNQGQLQRFVLDRDRYKLGRDRDWSDLEIPPEWEVISRHHAILQKEGEDYRIYDGDGQHPSTNGIFLNHTRINASQGYLLQNGAQLEIGQNPSDRIILTYFNPSHGTPAATPSKQRLSLKGLQEWPVELGREPTQRYSSIQLNSPTISRIHATIYPNSQGGYILSDRSTNGTFINAQRVTSPILLNDGDAIKIGPFTLLYRKETLEVFDRGNQIRLDAHDLVRQVKDKQNNHKIILNRVSLAIEPGQFVALVGGSGTGKSTLLKTLLGIQPTTSGAVFLNGEDLRQHFDIYRSQIGYVPQDDIVHLDLTVEEVLSYACKLRLPPDTDVNQVVQRTLTQVKLEFVKTSFVRDLSGGQRKRVSIGVELLADPKLFFLDEPTSGLDPGLDKEMMQLLREFADQGRTIVLVTHATANIEACDRIAFLGRGGYLCYFGPPKEAMDFFEMPSQDLKYFADIYIKLDRGTTQAEIQQNLNYWRDKYINSTAYQAYIKASLSPGKTHQFGSTPAKGSGISPVKQLLILCGRYLQLVGRDRRSLALALLTAPIGIALITITLQGKNPLAKLDPPEVTQAPLALRVLFVFTCAAIWVGLSSSVQEIVKEASIYARERLVNLGLLPYLGSKFLIRSGLAVIQTFFIALVILVGFKSPASDFFSWPFGLFITTFLTLLSTVSLGLMISSFVRNDSEANNTLPLILLPQIIFSGVLFKLEGIASKLSWLMLSRWSVGAYGALVNVNAMVPEAPVNPMGITVPQPFEPTPVYEATLHNLSLNWGILCLHIGVYLTVAWLLQKRKDIF